MNTTHRIRRRRADSADQSLPNPTTTGESADALTFDPRLALKVVYCPVASLRPSPHNARTHSKKQIHKIKASLRQFGFTNPILITADVRSLPAMAGLRQPRSLATSRCRPSVSIT